MQSKVFFVTWENTRKGSMLSLLKSMPRAGFDLDRVVRLPQTGTPESSANIKQLAAALAAGGPYDYSIHFQRFYPPNDDGVRKALERAGVKDITVDLAPIPFEHYSAAIFDGEGDNAASSIPGKLDLWKAHPKQFWAMKAQYPRVTEIAGRIKNYAAKFTPPGGIPKDFIFAPLQSTRDMVLKYDSKYGGANSMSELAQELAAAATAHKQFVVIKPHPMDKAWKWEGSPRGEFYRVLPQTRIRCEANNIECSWYWQNCRKLITVNSTMLFGGLFAGKPVAMLGRGWATGNGVAQECASVGAAFEFAPQPSANRVWDFLALILSRCRTEFQLKNPTEARALFDWLDALREKPTYHAPAIIRCIFIKTHDQKELVMRCLKHTIAKNPDSQIILPIDAAPEGFEDEAEALSENVVCFRACAMCGPHPPRMSKLLGSALPHVRGKYVVTAEQDTILHANIVERGMALLDALPEDVAAVQARSCDPRGVTCFPMSRKHRFINTDKEHPYGMIETAHATFSTTIWRTRAVLQVDWAATRAHGGCDIDAGAQLAAKGMRFFYSPDIAAIHYPHTFDRKPDPDELRAVEVAIYFSKIDNASGGVRRHITLANELKRLGLNVALFLDFPHRNNGNVFVDVPIYETRRMRQCDNLKAILTGWYKGPEWLRRGFPGVSKFYVAIGRHAKHRRRIQSLPQDWRIISPASATTKYVREWAGREPIEIIGGVDLRQFEFKNSAERDGVLYRCREQNVQAGLIDMLARKYKALAGVAPENVHKKLQKAKLFLNFERADAVWGNPVAEAMACGCVVVSSPSPSIEDLVIHGETGIIVKQGDPVSVVVDELLADEGELDRLRANARKHVEQFSYENFAARVAGLIENGIGEKEKCA